MTMSYTYKAVTAQDPKAEFGYTADKVEMDQRRERKEKGEQGGKQGKKIGSNPKRKIKKMFLVLPFKKASKKRKKELTPAPK